MKIDEEEQTRRVGILKFDLTSPDERVSFVRAVQADRIHWALTDFDEYLRKQVKYKQQTDEAYEIYEDIRSTFRDYMLEAGAILW